MLPYLSLCAFILAMATRGDQVPLPPYFPFNVTTLPPPPSCSSPDPVSIKTMEEDLQMLFTQLDAKVTSLLTIICLCFLLLLCKAIYERNKVAQTPPPPTDH